MKKYILSIFFLKFFFGCSNTSTDTRINTATGIDTVLVDTVKPVNPNQSIGAGLTLEEMADDSVFSDGSVPASWNIAGITDIRGFKLFLKQLQLSVLNNDKGRLSALVKYPLGKSIKNKNDFIKNYDRVFTKDVKLSIAKINFSQVFRNYKGAMTEGGKVWFSQEGKEFKIIAINPPL